MSFSESRASLFVVLFDDGEDLFNVACIHVDKHILVLQQRPPVDAAFNEGRQRFTQLARLGPDVKEQLSLAVR